MKKVLIVSGHPDIKNSLANKAIFKDLENVENISINNLANKYPDYKIDVEKEQELLLSHDIIIFQFPFYWYSVPGIMKKWMDDVFTY
jgi:putative NADPH-quinone reductase